MNELSIQFRDEHYLLIDFDDESYSFEYSKSVNGNNILAFSESAKLRGIGNYLVIIGNLLMSHGELVRPQEGKIGNNGNFILSDWLSPKSLKSTIHAYNQFGKELVALSLNANLIGNGISESGLYAIFQTANSNTPQHSNKMILINLSDGIIIWQRQGGANWPISFRIIDNQSIELCYKKRPPVILDWSGNIWGYQNGIETLPWVDER